MSDLVGADVHDSNFQYRLLLICSMGILAFGAVLYWRAELLITTDYQEFPVTHQQIKIIDQNKLIKKQLYGQN